MTTTATATTKQVLTDDMLARFAGRAAAYDRENRFAIDDFNELKDAGYLKMPIPRELGGLGFSLQETSLEQRRLGMVAAGTAVAVNMHLYWMGIARELWYAGDKSLEWMLVEGAQGEVYAAGHAERGNDLPALLSTSTAERVDGGYKLTGHKMFGSLSPVWTRFGMHAMDASDPTAPKIVHAFLPRDAKGYEIRPTWDAMGMRASGSDDTVLNGAFVPDKFIARVLPAGVPDMFILSLFAWALTPIANLYYGIALRARDLAIAGAKQKTSIAVSRSMAYHPEMQHDAARMQLEIEPTIALMDKVATDWDNHADYGMEWPAKLVGMKYQAVESAKRVVDIAMEMSGGAGIFKSNELERCYRDVRAGAFHPANAALVHEIVGKTALGIDLGEQPRWG